MLSLVPFIMPLSLAENVVLGGISAGFAGFLTNPLELMKVRLQLQGKKSALPEIAIYNGIPDALRKITKYEGLQGLMSGTPSFLLYQFALNGTRLATYSAMLSGIKQMEESTGIDPSKMLTFNTMLSGGLAGVFGAIMANPFNIAKTHQQSVCLPSIQQYVQLHPHLKVDTSSWPLENSKKIPGGFTGAKNIMTDIVKNHKSGFKGLYVGLEVSMVRIFFGSATQLSVFENTRRLLDNQFGFSGTFANACSSLVSAVVFALVTSPLDVISTNMFMMKQTSKSNSCLDIVRDLYKQGGISSFYRGVGALFLRFAPHSTITLTTWEELKIIYAKAKGTELVDKSSVKSVGVDAHKQLTPIGPAASAALSSINMVSNGHESHITPCLWLDMTETVDTASTASNKMTLCEKVDSGILKGGRNKVEHFWAGEDRVDWEFFLSVMHHPVFHVVE